MIYLSLKFDNYFIAIKKNWLFAYLKARVCCIAEGNILKTIDIFIFEAKVFSAS